MSKSAPLRSALRRLLPAGAQRAVRRWLNQSRRAQFQRRQIRRTYGGFAPLVELVDRKGEDWYDVDRPLEPEFELLRQHGLSPGARVFDLGAHQGVVALALAHLVGPTGQVIAVEANPFDAAAAARNAQLNEFGQIQVINAAIAASRGSVAFLESGRVAFGDPTQPTVQIEARSVDDLAQECGTPAVLFIDVDGFENQALRGAAEVLKSRPTCYVEVHTSLLPRYNDRAEDTFAFFPDDQFEVLVSAEARPSKRVFQPIDRRQRFTEGLHLVAFARHP